jgi:hypothetical protein
VFTSDGLTAYFYALTAHFGEWLKGDRRRRTRSQWQGAAGLLYGQVIKRSRRRKLLHVRQVIRLGTEPAFTAALQNLGFSGRVNTACIERVNLTIRRGVAALARRTWATALQTPHWQAHLPWWQAYSHFVRPHASLRVALVQAREGEGTPVRSRYRQQTEADGSWENEPKVDGRRGARLPATAGTRLKAGEARNDPTNYPGMAG